MLGTFVKTPLFDYQQEAVAKALSNRRYLLALDTGTGKSLCALAIFDQIKRANPTCLCFVLSTKTGLATWEREITKHTTFTCQENKVSIDTDISIITPPYYLRLEEKMVMLAIEGPVVLIIDECHFLKSTDSHFARVVRRTLSHFVCVYGLTASPLLNHIEDIFWLFESLFPGIFANDYEGYMNFYTVRKARTVRIKDKSVKFKEVQSYKNLEHLKERIGKFMYRKATNYKIDFNMKPTMLTTQENDTYLKAAQGVLSGNANPRSFVTRLPQLQLAANFSVDEDGEVRNDLELSSKEVKLLDMARQIVSKGESVIVFTYFRITLYRLKRLFEHHGIGANLYVITGTTSTEQRKQASSDLAGGDVVLATAAGAMSINLQAANHAIFFDLPWSVGTFCQSVGRIARVDSKFPVFNVYILGSVGTIDEYKLKLVSANITLIGQIIGGTKSYSAVSSTVTRKAIVQCRKDLLWKFHRRNNVNSTSGEVV